MENSNPCVTKPILIPMLAPICDGEPEADILIKTQYK
jgi:hypothetical protein